MKIDLNCGSSTLLFSTKGACLDFFSEMLGRYEPPSVVSKEDETCLTALLKHHPRCEAKVGAGIDHFEVRKMKYGAPCFHVVRIDGTVVDFSYEKAVRGIEPAPKAF